MPQVSRKDPPSQRIQDKESKRARGMSSHNPEVSNLTFSRCTLVCRMQKVRTSLCISGFLTICLRLKLKCDKIVPCSRSVTSILNSQILILHQLQKKRVFSHMSEWQSDNGPRNSVRFIHLFMLLVYDRNVGSSLQTLKNFIRRLQKCQTVFVS
jgi:hypothetical protein